MIFRSNGQKGYRLMGISLFFIMLMALAWACSEDQEKNSCDAACLKKKKEEADAAKKKKEQEETLKKNTAAMNSFIDKLPGTWKIACDATTYTYNNKKETRSLSDQLVISKSGSTAIKWTAIYKEYDKEGCQGTPMYEIHSGGSVTFTPTKHKSAARNTVETKITSFKLKNITSKQLNMFKKECKDVVQGEWKKEETTLKPNVSCPGIGYTTSITGTMGVSGSQLTYFDSTYKK